MGGNTSVSAVITTVNKALPRTFYIFQGLPTYHITGVPSLPIGLEDVTKFPNLTAELLNRGVKAADVLKVGGLNILRVWRSAERVAEEMRKEGALPLEDDIPKYKPAR